MNSFIINVDPNKFFVVSSGERRARGPDPGAALQGQRHQHVHPAASLLHEGRLVYLTYVFHNMVRPYRSHYYILQFTITLVSILHLYKYVTFCYRTLPTFENVAPQKVTAVLMHQ